MKQQNRAYELLFNYPAAFIFDDDCLEIGTDDQIHICMIEAEGYGTTDMCEYVTGEEYVQSSDYIDEYFNGLDTVTDLKTNEEISVSDFIKKVKDRYQELAKELDIQQDNMLSNFDLE